MLPGIVFRLNFGHFDVLVILYVQLSYINMLLLKNIRYQIQIFHHIWRNVMRWGAGDTWRRTYGGRKEGGRQYLHDISMEGKGNSGHQTVIGLVRFDSTRIDLT